MSMRADAKGRAERRAACTVAVLAACAVALMIVDPARAAWLPRCPVYVLFDLYCPGCGATRAMHLLLRGDLVGAAAMNAPSLLLLPALGAVLLAQWLAPTSRLARLPARITARGAVGIALGLLLYGLLRNLPWPAFAWMAPHGG